MSIFPYFTAPEARLRSADARFNFQLARRMKSTLGSLGNQVRGGSRCQSTEGRVPPVAIPPWGFVAAGQASQQGDGREHGVIRVPGDIERGPGLLDWLLVRKSFISGWFGVPVTMGHNKKPLRRRLLTFGLDHGPHRKPWLLASPSLPIYIVH